MKVRIDCEGCERKVKKAVEGMKGVSSVEVAAKQNKVTVTGYEMVQHPYAPGAYDKKAPAGYVRNVVADPTAAPLARASSTEVRYTAAFSDENPNACSVM
ncbi:Heavy metal-associated isoprenylated plant protein 27 [Zea mays]|uniref:Heavy metal-associated isoprenylated plant protein 27 n=1 Tax=Zea mays TaxID=4577 RepID=A0A1D6EE50_MAIZE|nr:Heavy metal-associated isoprenylated plant protein 27 [Zea mays]